MSEPTLGDPRRRRSRISWLVVWVFVFLYVPFLYRHGLVYARGDSLDFPTLYWAADLTYEQGRSPYPPGAFADVEAATGNRVFPFLYPPPTLLTLYPLTFTSHERARLLMLALNHAAVLALIWLLLAVPSRGAVDPSRHAVLGAVTVLYTLAHVGVTKSLEVGQVNLLVVVLLCLAWLGLKRGARGWLIALPLAGAVVLKTYPLLFLALLLIRRRHGAALWTVGILAAFTAAAALVLPSEVWPDWLAHVWPAGGYLRTVPGLYAPSAPANQSINGFVSRLFLEGEFTTPPWPDPRVGGAVAYAVAGLVTLVTLATAWRLSRRDSRRGPESDLAGVRSTPGSPPRAGIPNVSDVPPNQLDLEFSLFLLLMFLVSPISWDHHLVYILPACVVALSWLFAPPEGGRARRLTWLLVPTCLCLIAWDVPYGVGALKGVLLLALSTKFYAAAALWLLFAARSWRAGERPAFSIPASR